MMSIPRESLLADNMLGHMVVPESDMSSMDDNITVLDVSRDDIWMHVVESITTKRPGATELMLDRWRRDGERWERVPIT